MVLTTKDVCELCNGTSRYAQNPTTCKHINEVNVYVGENDMRTIKYCVSCYHDGAQAILKCGSIYYIICNEKLVCIVYMTYRRIEWVYSEPISDGKFYYDHMNLDGCNGAKYSWFGFVNTFNRRENGVVSLCTKDLILFVSAEYNSLYDVFECQPSSGEDLPPKYIYTDTGRKYCLSSYKCGRSGIATASYRSDI